MGPNRPGSAGAPQKHERLIPGANPVVPEPPHLGSRERKHRRGNSLPTGASFGSHIDIAYSKLVRRESPVPGNYNTGCVRGSLTDPERTKHIQAFVDDDERNGTQNPDNTVATQSLISQLEKFNCARSPTPLLLTRHRRFASVSDNRRVSSSGVARTERWVSLPLADGRRNIPSPGTWSTMAVHGSDEASSEDGLMGDAPGTDPVNFQDPSNSESGNVVKKSVWKINCEKKRAERERLLSFFKIPETRLPPPEIRKVVNFLEWGVNHDVLQYRDYEITELADIEQVLRKLRIGQWRCVDVIVAYIRRATIIHQLTNCLTEIMFVEAIARAQMLDKLPPGQRGPLHGLPFTVKDQFNVTGFDSTIGYASFIGNAKDLPPSTLVEVLQGQGAIVFAKTNVPQSLMWCETDNNIWGRTNNPRNLDYTPGGSTGGESVLLAMKGTLMGWGTDIGGSCRIPSALMGCWGLRPSSYRLPYYGVTVSTDGQEHVPSVIGPMTRTPQSLTFITRQVIQSNTHNFDPKVVPIPWREDLYRSTLRSKKLRIGLMLDDGVVRVHPPIARLLKWAATVLARNGHEIIPWEPDLHSEGIAVMDKFYKADGGADVRSAIEDSGENYIKHCQKLFGPQMAANAIDIPSYWKLSVEKRKIQKAYLDRWKTAGLDLLLTPVMPHVSVKHKHTRWVGYTKIWNVLDYTAVVLPNFGYVLADAIKIHETDFEWKQYKPRNRFDAANWKLYNPREMYNQPIAMQLVAGRYEEEKVLGGMQLISNTLKGCTEIRDDAYFDIVEPAGCYDEKGYNPFKLHLDEQQVGEVPSVPRRDDLFELVARGVPTEPIRRMKAEQPEYSSDIESSDGLSTIPEVPSSAVSEQASSVESVARTVTPSVCSMDSFITARSDSGD